MTDARITRITLNGKGIQALLRSKSVQDFIVQGPAARVAARLEATKPEHVDAITVDARQGRNRTHVRVSAHSTGGANLLAVDPWLASSLDAAR